MRGSYAKGKQRRTQNWHPLPINGKIPGSRVLQDFYAGGPVLS